MTATDEETIVEVDGRWRSTEQPKVDVEQWELDLLQALGYTLADLKRLTLHPISFDDEGGVVVAEVILTSDADLADTVPAARFVFTPGSGGQHMVRHVRHPFPEGWKLVEEIGWATGESMGKRLVSPFDE